MIANLLETGSNITYQTVKTVRNEPDPLVFVNHKALSGDQSPITSRPRLPSPESINGTKHINIIEIGASTDDIADQKSDKRQSVYSQLDPDDRSLDPNYTSVSKDGGSSGFFEDADIKSVNSVNTADDSHGLSTLVEVSDETADKRRSNLYVSEPTGPMVAPEAPAFKCVIPVSHDQNPSFAHGYGTSRRDSNTTDDSEERWVPWSDQSWVNTAAESRASVTSALPSQLPASTTSVTSALSQKYVIPKHSRQMMKQKRGPEDLRVHQARLYNAVFYASPNKTNIHK